ncbi:hypothetical protein B0675_39315 [Streptomyces sp. M41(2017)]|nr:hypothetical protein B0675_39315 [Streptomyces sp. M41(2017)]
MQQAADNAHQQLRQLDDPTEQAQQRQVWFEAAAAVQEAVTRYARTKNFNRYEVEKQLRHQVRHPETPPGQLLQP